MAKAEQPHQARHTHALSMAKSSYKLCYLE
jgi:hypothetical protein